MPLFFMHAVGSSPIEVDPDRTTARFAVEVFYSSTPNASMRLNF